MTHAAACLDVRLQHRYADGADLDLELRLPLAGTTALFGPSGSGKTTLLDAIAGLRPDLDALHVHLGGEPWQDGSVCLPPWQRPLAYVFQAPSLFPHLSVADNLAFAEARAFPGGPTRDAVIDLLGLAPLLARLPEGLSGGEQQRVAIGRALLRHPRLLLLDEPLASLDGAAAADCLAALDAVQRELSLPMLFVSHRLEEVQALADRCLLIDGGRITHQGALVDLAARLDTRLADDEAAAAILSVDKVEHDAAYGLSALNVDGHRLWVAAGPGARPRRLRVAARDVSVCRERPPDTSILNLLPATLEDARDAGPAHCLLRLRLRDQHLLARITRRSRDELALRVGDRLIAQVKSSALLRDEEHP
jgi:molybdate transport system ATP-binding protein